MNITKHFTLEELTYSATAEKHGIKNVCPQDLMENIELMAENLEVVRGIYNKPVKILSCFRSLEVNNLVGGSKTSSHVNALAVDFIIPGIENIEVCRKVNEAFKEFDQIIYEFGPTGWVHLGFGSQYRKQLLSAVKKNGKTVYLSGLIE